MCFQYSDKRMGCNSGNNVWDTTFRIWVAESGISKAVSQLFASSVQMLRAGDTVFKSVAGFPSQVNNAELITGNRYHQGNFRFRGQEILGGVEWERNEVKAVDFIVWAWALTALKWRCGKCLARKVAQELFLGLMLTLITLASMI